MEKKAKGSIIRRNDDDALPKKLARVLHGWKEPRDRGNSENESSKSPARRKKFSDNPSDKKIRYHHKKRENGKKKLLDKRLDKQEKKKLIENIPFGDHINALPNITVRPKGATIRANHSK